MIDTAILIFSIAGSIALISYQAYKRIISDYHHWKLSLKDREAETLERVYGLERVKHQSTFSAIPGQGHMIYVNHLTGQIQEFETSRPFAPPQQEQAIETQVNGYCPPVLPLLDQSQRILLTGGSGSGKTSLLLHLKDARLNQGEVWVLDPHTQCGKWEGCRVFGAGRNYQEIETALQEINRILDERYLQYSNGTQERAFPRLTVVADEFVNLSAFVQNLGELIKPVLVEGRKTAIDLIFATQSKRARNISLKGQMDLMSSFDILVDLQNENGNHRCFVDASGNNEWMEYSLPGAYMTTGKNYKGCNPGGVDQGCNRQNGGVHRGFNTGYTDTRATPRGNIDHIPEEDFRILDLWKKGFSLSKISKKIFNSKGGYQLKRIRETLKRYGRA